MNDNENEENQGIKENLRERLMQANSADELTQIRQELRDEGFKAGSIDAVAHELKRKGRLKFSETKALPKTMSKELIPYAMQSFIEEVYVPRPVDGQDGFYEGYEAGTRRARQDIFLAMLALKELSNLSVQQAQPLVLLAKELRPQIDAGAIAQSTAQQTIASIMPEIVDILKQSTRNGSPNPMGSMMSRLMEPYLQHMMSSFMGGFTRPAPGGIPVPAQQVPPQSQVQSPNTSQQGLGKMAGCQQASEEEVQEAFDDV